MSYWLNMSSVNTLNINSLVHFDAGSSVNDIMTEVFVDQWNQSISYRAFYEQCRPNICTYTLVQNNSFWFILTTIFGLIGALMKILQVIIPYLIRSVHALYFRYRRLNHRQPSDVTNSPTFSFRFVINRLRQLNVFASDNPNAADEHKVQNQIIATRIFFILLILSVVVLTIYSSQTQLTTTVTITNPSIEQYQSLYNSHSSTLTCPCKNIVVPHETFLSLQPIFTRCVEAIMSPING
jgi:hypothetical protein